ncbi:22154_t:CDS:2 [Dentiscutata erythropus]|uniref:22154_t:CDS:1 n=1 Tax=Dentiscutata erythropus TaxID=1348616 RepID=A0A9N9FRH9_9GLOM|nr:22154_t:CDS:2 [Dentiscutata erythropus]
MAYGSIGRPSNSMETHILRDLKKTLRTDVLNLVALLRNHLDFGIPPNLGEMEIIFQFLSSELFSATILFSFYGQSQYKDVFRMMARFHDEIMEQEELLGQINRTVFSSEEMKLKMF